MKRFLADLPPLIAIESFTFDKQKSDSLSLVTTTEYVGPESGSNRVGRSGGWDNDIEWCKVHARTQKESSFRDCQFGFRVVRNAQ